MEAAPTVFKKEQAGPEVITGTAIRDLREQPCAADEHRLGQLFKGYFNNKMTVLIFLIQAKRHRPEAEGVRGLCCFLDDLYRHMLEPAYQVRYRRRFLWLKRFIQKLPEVRPSQRVRAIFFVQTLYEILGIQLKKESGKERI